MRKPTYCEVQPSLLQCEPVKFHKNKFCLKKSNQLSRVTGVIAKVGYFQVSVVACSPESSLNADRCVVDSHVTS